VSHDRHMLELVADRLVLVDHGTAKDFTGSIDDYTDLILGRKVKSSDAPKAKAPPPPAKPQKKQKGARW
ncbi:MAG: ABC transporter ATP-binding protein, partial [Sandaracinobacteroides sp.]